VCDWCACLRLPIAYLCCGRWWIQNPYNILGEIHLVIYGICYVPYFLPFSNFLFCFFTFPFLMIFNFYVIKKSRISKTFHDQPQAGSWPTSLGNAALEQSVTNHYGDYSNAAPIFRSEGGGGMFIWNVGILPDCMVSQPRRPQSEHSALSKIEKLCRFIRILFCKP
jgi:hypothetical protein